MGVGGTDMAGPYANGVPVWEDQSEAPGHYEGLVEGFVSDSEKRAQNLSPNNRNRYMEVVKLHASSANSKLQELFRAGASKTDMQKAAIDGIDRTVEAVRPILVADKTEKEMRDLNEGIASLHLPPRNTSKEEKHNFMSFFQGLTLGGGMLAAGSVGSNMGKRAAGDMFLKSIGEVEIAGRDAEAAAQLYFRERVAYSNYAGTTLREGVVGKSILKKLGKAKVASETARLAATVAVEEAASTAEGFVGTKLITGPGIFGAVVGGLGLLLQSGEAE